MSRTIPKVTCIAAAAMVLTYSVFADPVQLMEARYRVEQSAAVGRIEARIDLSKDFPVALLPEDCAPKGGPFDVEFSWRDDAWRLRWGRDGVWQEPIHRNGHSIVCGKQRWTDDAKFSDTPEGRDFRRIAWPLPIIEAVLFPCSGFYRISPRAMRYYTRFVDCDSSSPCVRAAVANPLLDLKYPDADAASPPVPRIPDANFLMISEYVFYDEVAEKILSSSFASWRFDWDQHVENRMMAYNTEYAYEGLEVSKLGIPSVTRASFSAAPETAAWVCTITEAQTDAPDLVSTTWLWEYWRRLVEIIN